RSTALFPPQRNLMTNYSKPLTRERLDLGRIVQRWFTIASESKIEAATRCVWRFGTCLSRSRFGHFHAGTAIPARFALPFSGPAHSPGDASSVRRAMPSALLHHNLRIRYEQYVLW